MYSTFSLRKSFFFPLLTENSRHRTPFPNSANPAPIPTLWLLSLSSYRPTEIKFTLRVCSTKKATDLGSGPVISLTYFSLWLNQLVGVFTKELETWKHDCSLMPAWHVVSIYHQRTRSWEWWEWVALSLRVSWKVPCRFLFQQSRCVTPGRSESFPAVPVSEDLTTL